MFGAEPPKPRIEAVRIVDMSSSNAWAELAGIFARTRAAHLQHEQAKAELKCLMPEDAKEAIGQGIRARRSKSGQSASIFSRRETMQRSSSSIAALAAALAKAQGELVNPEKSLVGTIGNEGGLVVHGRSAMRRCPLASRSFARSPATMRSRPCKRRPSTWAPVSST